MGARAGRRAKNNNVSLADEVGLLFLKTFYGTMLMMDLKQHIAGPWHTPGPPTGSDLDEFRISGMDDFTAMFRDDFERDFGAWFTTGGNGDDPLESI